MKVIKEVFLATTLFLFTILSAHASIGQSNIVKAAMVDHITTDSNYKVAGAEALRIVNAVFTNAKRLGLDPYLIFSIIRQESRYKSTAKSSYGAVGIMQVVPRFHRDKLKGRSPSNIETNIEVGTQILSDCLNRSKGNVYNSLRCYSGNARNYATHIKNGLALARKADVAFRFKNELPIVTDTHFNDSFNISASADATTADSPVIPPTLFATHNSD